MAAPLRHRTDSCPRRRLIRGLAGSGAATGAKRCETELSTIGTIVPLPADVDALPVGDDSAWTGGSRLRSNTWSVPISDTRIVVPPNRSIPHQRHLIGAPLGMPPDAGVGESRYEDDALDRLADEIAHRLAARLGALMPGQAEALVDATETGRMYGKARSWVYEHAGELGAVRLGSGPRPRLAFSPGRVAASLERVAEPPPAAQPEPAQPRRRRQRLNQTAAGAPLLHVRPQETWSDFLMTEAARRLVGDGRRRTHRC